MNVILLQVNPKRAPGRLRAFVTVKLVDLGIVIHDIKVVTADPEWHLILPQRSVFANRELMRDEKGAPINQRAISFDTTAGWIEFTAAVLAALRASHPEIFNDSSEASPVGVAIGRADTNATTH